MSADDPAQRSGPEHEPAEPHTRDPYAEAPKHDPVFPSWRYAGLRWLAGRLYGSDRSQD